jgi:hypothetical protein
MSKGRLAGTNGLFQVGPGRIGNAIPKAQEGTQIGGGLAAQKDRGGRMILVLTILSFHKTERNHGIG